MINTLWNHKNNQEIKKSLQETLFNEEKNKKWLAKIQKETNKEKENQNKKAEQLKDLLAIKDDMEKLESIVRIPKKALHLLQRKKIKINKLPLFDPNKKEDSLQIDGRCCDVSSIDIKNNLSTVKNASFDNQTKRPKDINDYFNPEKIMELGKNPWLNINELHKRWITGKNIGIAIIDQTLLVKHKEYKDNLKLYDEIEANDEAQMHWAAVASIAVGKNTGVAPDANLYYIWLTPGTYKNNGEFEYDLGKFAKGIDKIVETNKLLPNEKKIRVISISLGMVNDLPGGKEALESIKRASNEGIYVVHTGDDKFLGAGRNPETDPNKPSSYTKGFRWDNQNIPQYIIDSKILFPMDSRSVASPTGNNDYVFYRHGWWSWVVPYIAGLYALCCQVKPSINKTDFWKAANQTSKKIMIENEEFKIINPVKLIEYLEKN